MPANPSARRPGLPCDPHTLQVVYAYSRLRVGGGVYDEKRRRSPVNTGRCDRKKRPAFKGVRRA